MTNSWPRNLGQSLKESTPPILLRFVRRRATDLGYWQTRVNRRRTRAERLGTSTRPFGLNVVGHLSSDTGLGVAARGTLSALEAAGVPFAAFDADRPESSTPTHPAHGTTHQVPLYRYTLLCTRPERTDKARAALPRHALATTYVIASWYWETEIIPRWWEREIRLVDEIWAPSEFLRAAFSRATAAPTHYMAPVVSKTPPASAHRSEFGLPSHRFLFLTMADSLSVLKRKNPVGAVTAYCRAFESDQTGTALVVKIRGGHPSSPELEEIRRIARGRKDIIVVEGPMSDEQMAQFISCCDCFVSLHRSEGFGLGPAEAMALGRPVLLTAWSGNVDYMTDDNCLGVSYQLITDPRPPAPYPRGVRWADPDLDVAASMMRRVSSDAGLAQSLGASGQATIRNQFSPAAVGANITDRLREIETERAQG